MRPTDLSPANRDYVAALYEQYQGDPTSVDVEWAAFFRGFDFGYVRAEEEGLAGGGAPAGADGARTGPERRKRERTDKGVVALVRAYRHRGHFIAQLDPLGDNRTSHPLLALSEFGLSEDDLEKGVGFGTFQYKTDGSLRALLAGLRQTYCGTLGIDTMATADKEQEAWIEEHMEPILGRLSYTPEEQRRILFQLVEAEEF